MVIYKYEIKDLNKWFELKLPIWSEPIAFQEQNGKLVMWVKLDENEEEEEVFEFIALGTGIPEDLEDEDHIGTAQFNGFVWHLFWRM